MIPPDQQAMSQPCDSAPMYLHDILPDLETKIFMERDYILEQRVILAFVLAVFRTNYRTRASVKNACAFSRNACVLVSGNICPPPSNSNNCAPAIARAASTPNQRGIT